MQYDERIRVYVVRKMRLAGWLMLHGFKLIKNQRDRNDQLRDVYLFDNSPELIESINEYKLTYRNEN